MLISETLALARYFLCAVVIVVICPKSAFGGLDPVHPLVPAVGIARIVYALSMSARLADSSLSEIVLIPPKLSGVRFIDLRSHRSIMELRYVWISLCSQLQTLLVWHEEAKHRYIPDPAIQSFISRIQVI